MREKHEARRGVGVLILNPLISETNISKNDFILQKLTLDMPETGRLEIIILTEGTELHKVFFNSGESYTVLALHLTSSYLILRKAILSHRFVI